MTIIKLNYLTLALGTTSDLPNYCTIYDRVLCPLERVSFFEFVFPFKATVSKKNDTSNVLQDINHIKSFNNDYPEMPNNDDRVVPNLNSDYKSQSDSSHSSMSTGGVDTVDFPSNNFGNDADSSDDIFAAQDEQVITLEDNKFEGDLDQNPSNSTQGTQIVIQGLATQQSPKEPFDLIEA
ncbi:hypothetical protein Tco_0548200 [Tanacetum coccineum]